MEKNAPRKKEKVRKKIAAKVIKYIFMSLMASLIFQLSQILNIVYQRHSNVNITGLYSQGLVPPTLTP